MERVWNAEAKASIRSGLLGAGFDGSAKVVERVETALDASSRDWVMLNEKLCNDALERNLISKELYASMSSCFDSALIRQRQVVALLTDAKSKEESYYLDAVKSVSDKIDECRERAFEREAESREASNRTRLRTCRDSVAASVARLPTPETAVAMKRHQRSWEEIRGSYAECMQGAHLKPWEQRVHGASMTWFDYAITLFQAINARFQKNRAAECALLKQGGQLLESLERKAIPDIDGYIKKLRASKNEEDVSDAEWLEASFLQGSANIENERKGYTAVLNQAPYCR